MPIQAAAAGAGRQGSWGRYRWGSFGSYGKDGDGSPSDKQEAEPSWPLNDASSINSLQDGAPPSGTAGALGTLLGPSGSENEAPLETLPTIVDNLGEASTTLSAVQETSASSPLVQEQASTFTSAQEPSETESLSGIQLIPIYADGSSVATPVEVSDFVQTRNESATDAVSRTQLLRPVHLLPYRSTWRSDRAGEEEDIGLQLYPQPTLKPLRPRLLPCLS